MRQVALSAVLLFFAPLLHSQESTVPRYLELRDGSILRLSVVDETWSVPAIRTEGKIEETKVKLSELQSLTFTKSQQFDKQKEILATIVRLGSEDFEEREAAHKEILKKGPGVLPTLDAVKGFFADLEIKSRLESLVNKLSQEERKEIAEFPYDVVEGKELLWGNAGDKGIGVQIDGKIVRLKRSDVLTMTTKPPDSPLLRLGGGTFRRLEEKDFPKGCTEEGFDATPEGRQLRVGENIEKLFIAKGFVLETSIKTSHVSVNDYLVKGKTQGRSCATHQPLYQGEITITFVKPGNERIPAAVHFFGAWFAYVELNGTSVHAYDIKGKELGKVAVQRREHDFMGFYSPVPIHKVTVKPNLQIDPDFTMDDLIFNTPRTLEPEHPDKCVVQNANGERILCKDVRFTPEGAVLEGLPADLPDRTQKWDELMRIFPPGKRHVDEPGKVAGVFVEMQDGSILFGSKPKEDKVGPSFARNTDLLKEPEKITGVWSAKYSRPLWPEKNVNLPAVARIDKEKGTVWDKVGETTLTALHIQRASTTGSGSNTVESYFESRPLLLRTPVNPDPGNRYFRTREGEVFVMPAADLTKMSGSVLKEIQLRWQGKEVKIAAGEIVAIEKPMKE